MNTAGSAPSSLFKNFKMVAIKKIWSPKENLERQKKNVNGRFSTLHFATERERERERRDCLVAKTIYFNITKLLRLGNIANGAQNPFKSIKFAILSRSSF